MTAKLRAELKAENVTDLPDNTSGLISASDLRGQMDDIIDSATFPEDGGAGSGGITVDTGEPYKIIMLSNGTVKAVPIDAVPPTAPTELTAVVRLTSVNLRWTASPGGVQYEVTRDGAFIGSTSGLSFRDVTVVAGNTYSYRVSSIDQYQQRSPVSTPVSATISLSLNSPPTDVQIRCWPTPIPTDGPAFVRVNGREIDVHNIAYALSVDAGTLKATDDPSVWVIKI